jgi:hypothetical protein
MRQEIDSDNVRTKSEKREKIEKKLKKKQIKHSY